MKISPKTWHWYLSNSGKGNHFWLGNCKLTKNDLLCSYFSKILPIFEWELTRIWKSITKDTAWKVSKYRVSSGPYFPIFGLNTKIYSVNLPIQSAYRKIETRKNSVFGYFSRSENSIKHTRKIYFLPWILFLKLMLCNDTSCTIFLQKHDFYKFMKW